MTKTLGAAAAALLVLFANPTIAATRPASVAVATTRSAPGWVSQRWCRDQKATLDDQRAQVVAGFNAEFAELKASTEEKLKPIIAEETKAQADLQKLLQTPVPTTPPTTTLPPQPVQPAQPNIADQQRLVLQTRIKQLQDQQAQIEKDAAAQKQAIEARQAEKMRELDAAHDTWVGKCSRYIPRDTTP